MSEEKGIRIALLSLHGLIRGENLELGRDEDTGGQTRYVVELARALESFPQVRRVDLITRQIFDDRVSNDYAQPEEQIGKNAYIVRIPFGPRRYFLKTSLWPYLDLFVDQCLHFFQKNRSVPDVLHGHYADAGYAGAQLARLLGIPFVFTGHSLGRVKRERLRESGMPAARMEKTYRISRRIEGEEFALETSSLIVTSTHQEVREQYEKYEQYDPERMEVIPPGVNLEAFRPPRPEEALPPIAGKIRRFLAEPDKPMILAMARPDERKNLERLVDTYGRSERLRAAANLVLILGSRGDLREMPAGQRTVLTNILTLIDVHDLYGEVAYPKRHGSDEVPEIYRVAAATRGVFVNPALTEPFGLTLLEAAASGLPIVATNDGGPSDILANCHNGVLIDPFDPASLEEGLLRMLEDPAFWETSRDEGLERVHRFYSWERHAERYLGELDKILATFDPSPALRQTRRTRRITKADRLLLTDIDNTLTGDDEAMRRFVQTLEETETRVGFGIATGRHFQTVLELLDSYDLPRPEILITSVGTEIYYGRNHTPDRSWRDHINYRWDPDGVRRLFAGLPGIELQDESEQGDFKISYQVDFSIAPSVPTLRRHLRENGLRVKLVLSLGMFLDVIPSRAGSGLGIRHLAYKWGFPLDHILVAGDSGNDEEMLAGNTLGVVVGNYGKELEKLRKFPRIYFAEAEHAAGILEGIEYYDFLGDIRIPNDRFVETAEEGEGQG